MSISGRASPLRGLVSGGLLVLAVGSLLAILGLLTRRAAAVGTGDVLFLLGLGLHLAAVAVGLARLFEHQSAA